MAGCRNQRFEPLSGRKSKDRRNVYDKLRLDLMYIENQTFMLNLKLLMLTFKIMFTPESTEGFQEETKEYAAFEKAMGSNKEIQNL